MKYFSLLALICFWASLPAHAASSASEGEISAKELAAFQGIETRKITFTFDSPVYAKADLVIVGGKDHGASYQAGGGKVISFFYLLQNQLSSDASQIGKMIQISLNEGEGSGQGGTYAFIDLLGGAISSKGWNPQLPVNPDPKHPVYLFLRWDAADQIDPKAEPSEIASKIKRGYYLVLHFSATPFK